MTRRFRVRTAAARRRLKFFASRRPLIAASNFEWEAGRILSQSRRPRRFRNFAHAICDLDSVVFTQFLPLRLIGVDLNPATVVKHPQFHDPLFGL